MRVLRYAWVEGTYLVDSLCPEYDSVMHSSAPTILELATGVALPSIAIVVSTLLAVWIASSERKSAVRARVAERVQIAQDRRDDRAQDAFERTVAALNTLTLHDPVYDSVVDQIRELRLGLSLLEGSIEPENETLKEWFELERFRCALRSASARSNIVNLGYLDESQIPGAERMTAGAPLHEWAAEFSTRLRSWRRNKTNAADIAKFVGEARSEIPLSAL